MIEDTTKLLRIDLLFYENPNILKITSMLRNLLHVNKELQLSMTDQKYNFLQYHLILDNEKNIKKIITILKSLNTQNLSLEIEEININNIPNWGIELPDIKPKTEIWTEVTYIEEKESSIRFTDNYWRIILANGNTRAKKLWRINNQTVGCIIAEEHRITGLKQNIKIDLDIHNMIAGARYTLEVRRITRIDNDRKIIAKQYKSSQESLIKAKTDEALILIIRTIDYNKELSLVNAIRAMLMDNGQQFRTYLHYQSESEAVIVIFGQQVTMLEFSAIIRDRCKISLRQIYKNSMIRINDGLEFRLEKSQVPIEYIYNRKLKFNKESKINQIIITVQVATTIMHSIPSLFSPLMKESDLSEWKLMSVQNGIYVIMCTCNGNYGALKRLYAYVDSLATWSDLKYVNIESTIIIPETVNEMPVPISI